MVEKVVETLGNPDATSKLNEPEVAIPVVDPPAPLSAQEEVPILAFGQPETSFSMPQLSPSSSLSGLDRPIDRLVG